MARTRTTAAAGEKKTTTRSKKTAPKTNGNLEEVIRVRAYQLYESRGRQHGADENDWFAAEAEVRSQTA